MEHVNEHDLQFRDGDHGVKYLFRGPRHEWGIIVVKAGSRMSPHKHEQVEETFYFEQGTPQFVVDGVPHRVKPGDVFKLAPGESHEIINDGDQDTRLIFIKCPYLPNDKIDLA
jgi:mannose-6-phosphate isomerase-like protein (cupin superfamily)